MKNRMIAAAALLLLAAAALVGWRWYAALGSADGDPLHASGMIEATEVGISSEVGGRLAERPVREGDRVGRGGVLARFDTELLDHQIQLADTATRLHLEQQRDRQTLRAPFDGWVARTVFEPGEVVPPGAPVAVVADWRELTLKVYLPEDRFGRVALGQGAAVAVDAYPGETFAGTVSAIGSTAEFTPRNVQTAEDRVKSVYAIKVRVPNADLRLKPGMFGDAVFVGDGAAAAR
jgi:membrane fusion protein YbhG